MADPEPLKTCESIRKREDCKQDFVRATQIKDYEPVAHQRMPEAGAKRQLARKPERSDEATIKRGLPNGLQSTTVRETARTTQARRLAGQMLPGFL